jgi:hypothetical protein
LDTGADGSVPLYLQPAWEAFAILEGWNSHICLC